jgi:hypothetical protein
VARQPKRNAGPTPGQVKAMIDALDRTGQFDLFGLVLADPKSHLGQLIREMGGYLERRLTDTEKAAGLAPEDIDPHQLLCNRFDARGEVLPPETMRQQAYRLGFDMSTLEQREKSVNKIRSMRARVRTKKAEYHAHVDVARGGNAIRVTYSPFMSGGTELKFTNQR